MKLFIKLMLFVVVLAMAGPFFMTGPDGRPLLTLQKLGFPSVSQLKQMVSAARNNIKLPNSATENTTSSTAEASVSPTIAHAARGKVFYKWQNDQGTWQFSNDPPPSPTTYQEIYTDPQANIIQSMPKDTIEATLGFSGSESTQHKKSKASGKPAEEIESGLSLTTVPITQIPKLMEDAKAARQVMDEHQKNLDKSIDDAAGTGK